MFPSPDEVSVLRGYLAKALQFSHDTEFELRFSTFTRNDLYSQGQPADPSRKPQNYRFVPIIDQGLFYRTLETFRTYGLIEHRDTVTDVLYSDYVRQTIDAQGNSTWLTKTRSRHTDFYDYNVRASWATEVPHAGLDPQSRPEHVRAKDRTSFTDGCARYDFTVVNSHSQDMRNGVRTSFEIEIEFLPPSTTGGHANLKHLDYAVNHMIFCMRHMLITLQGAISDIISLSARHNVLLEYNTVTHLRHFLGAQPETLHRHHLNQIRNGYSISEKLDGERYLFFVSDNGYSYLIDRSMHVKLAKHAKSQLEKGTILDVELYEENVFAFDIVFHRGKDFRDRPDMSLLPRLTVLKNVVDSLKLEHESQTGSGTHHLHLKPHYFSSDFSAAFDRWKDDSYEDGIPRDGFIFTPVNEPYPSKTKWGNLLKWKPADMNSIDFLLGEPTHPQPTDTADEILYPLLVGDKDHRNTVFEPCPTLRLKRDDPLFTSLRPGMVLECTYNNQDGFLPWRPRKDKQRPNYRHIALDVWKNMHEPVHIHDLERSPLESLRKFHNRVKEMVINKSVCFLGQEPSIVLDLACGRGGDLHKWRKARVAKYVGVDVSPQLLHEAKSRACEVERKNSAFNTQFCEADLRKPLQLNKDNLDLDSRSVDIVSCQFALHYFYESENAFTNFIRSVTSVLKQGGIFTASLFDGYRLFDICARGDNEQTVNGAGFTISPHFDVRMGVSNLKNKEFNIPIAVVINGDDDVILKSSTVEYVVFPDQFLLRMQSNGFHLLETKLFLDSSESSDASLNDLETAYSDLHRYYIFRYHDNSGTLSTTETLTGWKEIKCPTFPDSMLEANIFKDGSEPPQIPKLFVREREPSPSPCDTVEDQTWMTFYLDIITGRPTAEMSDIAQLSEHYNVFISVITVDDNDVVANVETHKPTIYLEDVKHIYFLRGPDKLHKVVARECTDTRNRFLWFPSFADTEEDEQPIEDKAVSNVTEQVEVPPPVQPDFLFNEKMTIRELQELAISRNIKIPPSTKRKADILTFLASQLEK